MTLMHAEVMEWLEDALARNQIVHEHDRRKAAVFVARYRDVHRLEFQIDGRPYIATKNGHTFAKCCGSAVCKSTCKAIIYHGPGHQSRSHCERTDEHVQHHCRGPQGQDFYWTGEEGYAKYTWSYDESPEDEA